MNTQESNQPTGRVSLRGRTAVQGFLLVCILVVSFVSGRLSGEATTGRASIGCLLLC